MYRFTLSFLFILVTSWAFAQDVNNLAVDGTVKADGAERATNATITLIQDGAQIDRVTTGKNGRFDLYLDFGHEYIIAITKSGYVTKKLYLNTNNVPEDEQMWGYEYGGFIVDLFKELPGVDYSILNKPIGKVYYEPNVENFVDDRVYTRQIKDELAALEEAYKDQLRNEANAGKQMEEDYKMALKDAQLAMEDEDYELAIENLQVASSMKPSASEPKKLMAEAQLKIQAQQSTEQNYANALASADADFKSGNYEKAKAGYNAALRIKADESYPKLKIEESERKIQEQKAADLIKSEKELNEKKYQKAVASGDEAFNSGNFLNARTFYQNALGFKEDPYPTSQLAKVATELEKEAAAKLAQEAAAEKDAQYSSKIDKGDAAFAGENWLSAKRLYEEALAIKPAQDHPTNRLSVIAANLAKEEDAKLASEKQAALNKQYQNLIVSGDRAMNSKGYDRAEESFRQALDIKPDEEYPKAQLAIIEQRRSEIATRNAEKEAKEEADKAFQAIVDKADAQFASSDYVQAKATYNQALGVRPSDAHSKSRIAEINKIAENESAKQANKERYDQLISQADGAMDTEDYERAKSVYEQALALVDDAYPKSQLELISQKQKAQQLAQNQEKDKKNRFNQLMKQGNEAVIKKEWSQARSTYNAALGIYPDDEVVKTKLKLVDDLEAKQNEKATQLAYNELINDADRAFLTKKYDLALTKYNAALDVIPGEAHPITRINKIEQLQAEMQKDNRESEIKEERRVVEEEYEEGRSKVTLRKVYVGDKVQTYKRVVHAWGGKYFFLEDQPITELVWNRETSK